MPDLPATRKWFDELFEVRNDPEPHHPWRDDYFGISTPLYKRAQLAGENTLSAPLVHSNEQESNGMDEEVQLAKTWIRVSSMSSDSIIVNRQGTKVVIGKCTYLPGGLQARIGQREVDDS